MTEDNGNKETPKEGKEENEAQKKKDDGENSENGTASEGEGEVPNAVKTAREEREKMEKVRDDIKEERKKLEDLSANRALEGETHAGVNQKKEETEKDYAKKVMEGKLE